MHRDEKTLGSAAQKAATAALFDAVRIHLTGGPSEAERLNAIEQALRQGADVNARGAKKNEGAGSRALHLAAGWAEPALVESLLRAGADVGARRSDGATPMHVAAARVDGAPIVALLARWGADPNAVDKSGEPALARAFSSLASRGGFETAQALLDAGAARPNGGPKDAQDFRWRAAQSRNGAALAFMAARGANLSAPEGARSLWVALARGPGPGWAVNLEDFEKCCHALDAAGAVCGPEQEIDALCEGVRRLPAPALKRLAQSVGDFSQMWPQRERALAGLFESGARDALEAALGLGLDPRRRWSKGGGLVSQLCGAIGYSNYGFQPGAIELAVGAGADPNEPDANGWRPLAIALLGRSHEEKLARELLGVGADPRLPAWEGGPSLFAFACGCRGEGSKSAWGVDLARQLGQSDFDAMARLGADANEKVKGQALLYWALRLKSHCEASTLLRHGAAWEGAYEALEGESDREYVRELACPKTLPRPDELPWGLRRWIDAGASPSRLLDALSRACEGFEQGGPWKASAPMALLEALALREQAKLPAAQIARARL